MKKPIEKIFRRPEQPGMVGDGFRVYNYFPSGYKIQRRVSPFLLLDFNAEYVFPPSDKIKGVDVHPHKGFETVTIAYKGSVAHHDSTGNSGIIGPGDVQWMTAGAGILHKEYHEENFSKSGGAFEMIQLWVNLPKKDKLTRPKYQAITSAQMGKYLLPEEKGQVNVIAGVFNGVKGPASTFTPINLFDLHLKKGAGVATSIPESHNTLMLVINGKVEVNDAEASLHSFVLFKNEGEEIIIEAKEESVILLLSGEPIDEPIAQYDPFAMNTQQEIIDLIHEFEEGKFGHIS